MCNEENDQTTVDDQQNNTEESMEDVPKIRWDEAAIGANTSEDTANQD